MNEVVYLNGAFLPLNEARVPVMDYGFLFAYGIYETTRTYQGRFFRLDAHLKRLEKSAAALSLPVGTLPRYKEVIQETVRRNPFENGRMRLTLTAGAGAAAPDLRTCQTPTVLVTLVEYRPFSEEIYRQGYSAITGSYRRNSQSILPGMKSISFVESMLAKQEARLRGVDENLLLNDKGYLAESSSSNVFLVSRGVLKTPRLGSGFLPGITRQVILELAAHLGMDCQEMDILPSEMALAEEVFISNSMIEIMPLTRIDGRQVGTGQPGQITLRLSAAYKELLREEVR